jgi:NADH-quinone oxidoreductase subunit G
VLGNLFSLDGFDYVSVDEVRDEIKSAAASLSVSASSEWRCPASLATGSNGLMRVGHLPLYAVDALVRRSEPLQATRDTIMAAAYINSKTANQQGLSANQNVRVVQDQYSANLPVVIDEGVPDQCVFIPAGVKDSQPLGDAYGSVELEQA